MKLNLSEKYWASIAEAIAADFRNGHPQQWRKGEIELFLAAFLSKLEEVCRQDAEKAKRCGVPKIQGVFRYDQLRLSYDSFRRIFITQESEGNLRTKEMFAIYFGFDSYNDYLIKNDIKAEGNGVSTLAAIETPSSGGKVNPAEKKFAITRLKIIKGSAITFVILLLLWFCFPLTQEKELLLFGYEDGIAIMNLKDKKINQLITNLPGITGIEVDVTNRYFFWSDYMHGSISKAQLNNSFTARGQSPIQVKFIDGVHISVGIALNPVNKRLYCALYGEHTIAEYDYDGQLINRCFIEGLEGRPSSLEMDIENQILYWTDRTYNKIGRFDFKTKKAEINFIANAGPLPDGLSIDPVGNKLYWTNVDNKQIGWTDLSKPEAHFIPVEFAPSATKVDAENRVIYYSAYDSDVIIKGKITKDDIKFDSNDKFFVTYKPSVIKLIKIKS